MHLRFLNLPIEYYTPISGGGDFYHYNGNRNLLILSGRRATVLARINDDPIQKESVGEFAEYLYTLITDENLRLEYNQRATRQAVKYSLDETSAKMRSFLRT